MGYQPRRDVTAGDEEALDVYRNGMRDSDVREALHMYLDNEHSQRAADTLLVDELGLCGQVRVDVAVVNGALTGYELKSAQDTLRRLPVQAAVYSKVLDYAHLVVAQNHVRDARSMVPGWWGLIEASWTGTSVALTPVLEGKPNPGVDPYSLAQLLWRDEALRELELREIDKGVRTKPRNVLWQRLANEVPVEELRSVVRNRLKSRTGWRVGP